LRLGGCSRCAAMRCGSGMRLRFPCPPRHRESFPSDSQRPLESALDPAAIVVTPRLEICGRNSLITRWPSRFTTPHSPASTPDTTFADATASRGDEREFRAAHSACARPNPDLARWRRTGRPRRLGRSLGRRHASARPGTSAGRARGTAHSARPRPQEPGRGRGPDTGRIVKRRRPHLPWRAVRALFQPQNAGLPSCAVRPALTPPTVVPSGPSRGAIGRLITRIPL
jgi:hypothetical protein